MIPSCRTEFSAHLPEAARYWTPKRSEIHEEGFGYFRDVWPIVGVTRREAGQILVAEQASAVLTDSLAANAAEFDVIARAVENRTSEGADVTVQQAARIDEFVDPDDFSPIGGLEIGVAGLSYALSAAGMFPAASCRGHIGPRPWSDVPVVLLAADRRRAEILQPLVEEAGAGFGIDVARACQLRSNRDPAGPGEI